MSDDEVYHFNRRGKSVPKEWGWVWACCLCSSGGFSIQPDHAYVRRRLTAHLKRAHDIKV